MGGATMAALYHGLGVSNGVMVVVILTHRFTSFRLPLLVGLPLIPTLGPVSGHNRTGASHDSIR